MKLNKILLTLYVLTAVLSTTSCQRNSNEVWEDGRSASRHMSRGLRTMGGKNGNSRAVQSRDDFMNINEDEANDTQTTTMGDFVPLSDQYNDNEIAMADFVSRQPKETPGELNSSIPGIESFQDPSMNPTWASIFRTIHFDLNSNLVKGQANLSTVSAIANYMKRNPNTYVFIEGHCDEKGPEAYNFALGSRRSNSVRNLLIQEGVNPDNLFTISFGKERPLLLDHNEEAWGQNRRAEFKIYQR